MRKAKVTREDVDKLGETTTWSSEQVAKEADFQAKKFRGKLLDEAIKPNSLLTEAELQLVGSGHIQDHTEKVGLKDSEFWKGHARKTRRLTPCLKSLRGQHAVFAVDVEPILDNDEINKKWQLKFVDDPHTASVFIMNDCSEARTSVMSHVSLVGGVLLSTAAYKGFDKSGVDMQHETF